MFKVPEKYRVTSGPMGSDASYGNNGAFYLPKHSMLIIASDQLGWEHVSVTKRDDSTPTWEEMCMVKDLFWDPDDCVVQYHPPKSDYVNNHPGCLHLWRPVGMELPRPPSIMVGVK